MAFSEINKDEQLILALGRNNLEEVERLLSQGHVAPNFQDVEGKTALMWAAMLGRTAA